MQISENTQKETKLMKKQAQKINFKNEKQLTKLIKKIDLKLFHQQLKHVRMLKHVLKTVRDIKIQNELLKDCKICTHVQRTKMQNHKAVKSVSKSAEHLHLDF